MKIKAHWAGRLWESWQPVVKSHLLSRPGCESVTYLGASRRTTKKRRQDRSRTARFSRPLHTRAGRRSNGRGAAVTSGGSHSMNHASNFLLSQLFCHKLYSINWYNKYQSVYTASKFYCLLDQPFDQRSLYVAFYKDGGSFTSLFPLSTKANLCQRQRIRNINTVAD